MDLVKRKVLKFHAKSGLKAKQPTSTDLFHQNLSPSERFIWWDLMLSLFSFWRRSPQNLQVRYRSSQSWGWVELVRLLLPGIFMIIYLFTNTLIFVFGLQHCKNFVQIIFWENIFLEKWNPLGVESSIDYGESCIRSYEGRRYVVVLDDMLSVEAWDQIHRFLPDNGNGSCVIVTSWLSNLVPHLSSFPSFEMNFLDKDRSWELFTLKDVWGGRLSCWITGNWERDGEEMHGTPSINCDWGHLKRSFRAIKYWKQVASFMNPISSLGEDEQCLVIINLSYVNLPIHLKPCFLLMWKSSQRAV